MKSKGHLRNHLIGACLAVILVASAGAGAADAGDSDAKKKDAISVHVVLPEQPIVARTRVAITVKIKNISDEPVDLPWPKFINQFIRTESTHRDGTVLTIRHAGLALGHGKYPGGDLKPSEEMAVEVWHIFQDTDWHSFKCVLETSRKNTPWWSFWEGRVESEPVSVEVKPSPHQDADKPVSESQDSTRWPTKVDAFSYLYQPTILGSQMHLGMSRSGRVSYSFSSQPHTGSGGLAARDDANGLALLEAAAKKQAEELQGFNGLAFVDDPRCEAIMAVEKLEPRKALVLYVDYLESLREIHQRLYLRRLMDKTRPFCLDLAVSRAYQLAQKESKKSWLVGRFASRFEGNPKDSDTAYVLAALLDADGQKEKARDVRLAEIRNTAQSAEEAAIRTLDFESDRRQHATGQQYRETVARMSNGYRDLLKLDAPRIQTLRSRHKTKPFLGTWRFDSIRDFQEIVKFKIADCLPPKEALAVYKNIFAANPKAEYGGCFVSILNDVFRELEGRKGHRRTVAMYAEVLRESPGDRQLKVLYLRSVLAAEMADEAKRLLTEMLQSPDWRERSDSTYWLDSYYRLEKGNCAQEAVAMLAQALTDRHPFVRKRAAHELGQLHKPPEEAAIALQKATRDPDPDVRTEATQALRNIGRDPAKRSGRPE
jgi:hypothetical protein